MRLLFLCTHNSARSILAEGLANHLGESRLQAFSAGSHPSGRVNPYAIAVLREHGCPVEDAHSKSWDVFAAPGAEPMNAVITVCDDAAGEACPIWPGAPVCVHWGLPDPSRHSGDPALQMDAFRRTADRLSRRLRAVLTLPLDRLGSSTLQHELQDIHAGALHAEGAA